MKIILTPIFISLLLSLPTVTHSLPSVPPSACMKYDVKGLHWLEGAWRTSSGNNTVEETWMAPTANSLIGMGRTLSKGKTVFFEYMRIEARTDGVYFIAHPKAAPGTEFWMTVCDDNHIVFENQKHDFPKVVRYKRNADGSMTATVEGLEKGKPAKQVFPYKRSK